MLNSSRNKNARQVPHMGWGGGACYETPDLSYDNGGGTRKNGEDNTWDEKREKQKEKKKRKKKS